MKSLVIPATEWRRIQENISGINKQEQALRAAQNEREALRNKSKAMVKNWSNTIEVIGCYVYSPHNAGNVRGQRTCVAHTQLHTCNRDTQCRFQRLLVMRQLYPRVCITFE